MSALVTPYGNANLLPRQTTDDVNERIRYAESLPRFAVSDREQADILMLGLGAYTPLTGFMHEADWLSVCDNMTLANGLMWPIPITLTLPREAATNIELNSQIYLVNHAQQPLAIMTVEAFFAADDRKECQTIYQSEDPEHPGVRWVNHHQGIRCAGPVEVLTQGGYRAQYPEIYFTPEQTRQQFTERGWSTVCAFQSRNPMHRAHEYLAKIAIEVCDGLLVHSVIGPVKADDIPADVRIRAIRTLLETYFHPNTVIQGGYPMCMRYAGPREALLHAIIHQNYGCSHIIIGRDHAGVNGYYAPFAAQAIFDEIATDALQISPLKLTLTFWCRACDGMASQKTCPHDAKHWDSVSGTELRRALLHNTDVPKHFSRPEILQILKEYYQQR